MNKIIESWVDFTNKNRNIILTIISIIILIIIIKYMLSTPKQNVHVYTTYEEIKNEEEDKVFNPVEQLLQCDLGQQDPKIDCQSKTIIGYRRWICQQYPEDSKKLGVICNF